LLLFLIAFLVVAADQLSKLWIRANLAIGESIFEIGFFRFLYVRNTGAAFGLFQGHSFTLTIINIVVLAALLVFVIFIYHRYYYLDNTLGKIAIGLILGGQIGNLIDRLRIGYVTDFIDFNFWPTFNVADSAVTVGIIILVFSLIRLASTEKRPDEQGI